MKKFTLLSAIVVVASLFAVTASASTIITDWTFETSLASSAANFLTSSNVGPLLAETGTGSVVGFHSNAGTVWSGVVGNGSTKSISANAWSVGDYYQFTTSTLGYGSIGLSWDQTSSTTGPRDFIVQYSLNGTSFTTAGAQYTVGSASFSGGTFNQAVNFTRSNISTAIANQATVYFRLVDNSTFGNNVNTPTPPTGTDRMDNVKVLGIAPLANPTYWDVNGASSGLGGTGTWNTANTNWNDVTGTGTPVTFNNTKAAVFSGTAGTVTVSGAGGVTANGGIEFDTNGYTITGTTVTMGSTSTVQVTNGTDTGTINAPMAGTNGLTITGNGTLVLGGTNTYQGQVQISGATLSVSHQSQLGDVNNPILLDTGTLRATDNVTTAATQTFDGTGTLDVASGKTLQINGATGTNSPGDLTFTNTGTVVLNSAATTTGKLLFNASSTLKFGSSGTGTGNVNGGIQSAATSGTTNINGFVNFNGVAQTVNVSNANSAIVMTGGLINSLRVSFTGPGSIDLQGDDSGLTNTNPLTGVAQIGSLGSAGPIVTVHNANSLGAAGTMFFNSGTINAATPITFGTGLNLSLGAESTAAAQFTATFSGANQTYLGQVALFEDASNDNRITVNNTTTFAGGWGASSITTASPSVVINGSPSGKLVLGGIIALDKPMAIQTVTVDVEGTMTNPAATILVSAGGTLTQGVDNALPTTGEVTVGSTLNGNGTYNLNGHNQNLTELDLVGGSITGSSSTVTATTDYTVEDGTVSAKLAGSVGVKKNSQSISPSVPGTVTLSGNNSYSGSTTVNGGTLIVAHQNALGTGGLTIRNSATTVLQSGLAQSVVLPSLTIDGGTATPTSKIDITNNKMAVQNGSYGAALATHATITSQVQNAWDNFAWDGGGVTSSTVQTDINNGALTSVGIMLNNDGGDGNLYEELGGSTFGGRTTSVNDVLVRYTYLGDLDLNGVVDSNDFNLFSIGYSGGAPQVDWAWGDLDYNGVIDSDDFNLFALGYATNVGLPAITSAGGVQPVPEPSTLVLAALGLAGIAAVARRRKVS